MRKLTTKEFIDRAINVHGDKYDYDKVIYVNNHIKIDIYCKTHKEYFIQIPNSHLNGKGCKKCGMVNTTKKQTKTKKQFIKEAINIHGNKYGYDKVIYKKCDINIWIYCKKCKKYFEQTPSIHIYQKSGCPICKKSHGEKEVNKYLDKNNIQYITQKRYNDCKNKRSLPFDFYLPKYNICIEYQGEQHYKPVTHILHKVFTIEESIIRLKKQQNHDKIKKEYCKNNNIKLIEIPYWDFKNIEKILNKELL